MANTGIAARINDSKCNDERTEADRIAMLPALTRVQLDALHQLVTPVWDGNLISKSARSDLIRMGLASSWNGLNFATQDGYCVLDMLRMLGDTTLFIGGLPKKKK